MGQTGRVPMLSAFGKRLKRLKRLPKALSIGTRPQLTVHISSVMMYVYDNSFIKLLNDKIICR